MLDTPSNEKGHIGKTEKVERKEFKRLLNHVQTKLRQQSNTKNRVRSISEN